MYGDLKQHFWWNGMKQDIATYVGRCLICQQVKIEHQRASGLLQPLDIPVWKWDEIFMDFVMGLPRTQKKNDAIWVVVDRLTKSAHFLPIRKDFSINRLANIFQQEIVRLQGTLTLEDMLRSCALEWTGNWDEYLCLVEFAYNNSWHASIKAAPYELLQGRKCRAPCWNKVGERVIEGLELIEVTNEKIVVAKEKLKEARSRQKIYVERHRRSFEFNPGDRVFLKGAYGCILEQGVTKFVNSNSASTSSSGTLPSNTISNPRSDLKAITTQSGVSYDGPQIPPSTSFLPKVLEDKLEATKETVNPTNNGST
uniref:Retrotransposon protein, putative, Ty3-gypsy subclass n=1 Tax=Tanacetum cinerariifolium TaxID=118510 RepID=A0A699HCK5_TANCI|nr:retrotransposon protein, putative, Ty3-gypsy subclass [Tanacetum cinerariifolium]